MHDKDGMEKINYEDFLIKPKDDWIRKSTTNIYYPQLTSSSSTTTTTTPNLLQTHRLRKRHQKRFSVSRFASLLLDDNTSTIVKCMAVTTTKIDQAAIEANIERRKKKKEEEEERESKKSTQPPPPPLHWKSRNLEIGSGCVRCVWDVYYEKLEAYDKLYNSSDPKKLQI
ncbi:hypothetical protein LWI29_035779 [Acer saccharum]|uniref:Oxidoreductase-like domain-containing protein n=1 Tax=Acer saccharum TaxID=4024 RepID=A0AA39RQ76_ACESA|nr:hypothetical protein LWI29_035779 [Acer saccharum]